MIHATIAATLCAAFSFLIASPQVGHTNQDSVDPISLRDRATTGDDCYHGNCTDCKDCSKTKGLRACYNCCVSNCLGNGDLQCQGKCDKRMGLEKFNVLIFDPHASHVWLSNHAQSIDLNVPLNRRTVRVIEYVSTASDLASIRKLGLSILIDAWLLGLIEPESESLIEETFTAALIGPDYDIRATAYRLVIDEEIPANFIDVAPCILSVASAGASLESEIAKARPGEEQEVIEQLAEDHRRAAQEAFISIMDR